MWCFQILYLALLLDFQADPVDALSHITGRKKYFIGTDRVTANQAVEMCRRRSMKLASIRNEKENNDILRFLLQQDLGGGFYVSGKKLSYGEAYSWLDGKLIEFFSWNAGEPNGYLETESCLNIFIVNGALKWDDQPCEYPGFYLCESIDEETQFDEDDSCYSKNEKEQKYYLGTEKLTYFDAIQYCEKMFMQLATIKNAEEEFSIHSLMQIRGTKADAFWIAANQKYGWTVWRWLDGTALKYFNWNKGEPNNDGSTENSVSVFKNGQELKWDDAPCAYKYPAICERMEPDVEIYVNRKLISSNKRKSYPSHSESLKVFLELEKNNFLLGWDIVKK